MQLWHPGEYIRKLKPRVLGKHLIGFFVFCFYYIKSNFIGVIKNEAPSDGYSFICIALAESRFETPFY